MRLLTQGENARLSRGRCGPIGLPASGGATPAFDPTTIGSGTVNGWWTARDPASVSVASDEVTQWSDKSGEGNHLAPAGGAFQPGYDPANALANGRPALTWPSTPGHGIGLGMASPQTVDFFMVVLAYGTGAEITYDAHRYIWTGDSFSFRTHGTLNNNHITSLFGSEVLLNGASIAGSNSLPMGLSILEVVSGSPGARALQWLGVAHNGINGWYGVMGEAITTVGVPSGADRTYLREGLADAWGITL